MKKESRNNPIHPVDCLRALVRHCYPGLEVDEEAFEEAKRTMDNTDAKSVPMAACADHKEDYLTPLICTLAFYKKEFWCPYCGRTYGFLDPYPVNPTDELQRRLDLYEFASRKYLRARGAMQPGARIKIPEEPEPVRFEYLSDELQAEYASLVAEGWQTGERAEYLYDADYLVDFVKRRTGLEPQDLQCPREKSATTPCAARDGRTAVCEGSEGIGLCVGCEHPIVDLVHTEVKHWKEKQIEQRQSQEGSGEGTSSEE